MPGAQEDRPVSSVDRDALPTLYRDTAFWGMTSTQFLGAFNDNLFKQLMLLLALKVCESDLQWLAMLVFSIAFVLFSGFAGYLSDRNGKRRIIVLSKVAEIVVMLLGMAAFALYGWLGLAGLLIVLFLMGTQSAFFGPGKYGILPEMLRERDLPRANGLILMTTFLAIIFGTVAAGFLSEVFVDVDKPVHLTAHRLWMASGVCVAIAIAGTLTSLAIRYVPAAKPNLEFRPSSLAIPPDTWRMLRSDPSLLVALLASSTFWMVASLVQPTVNSFGEQLDVRDLKKSILVGSMGLGIAAGAIIAGWLSKGKVDRRIVGVGAWGIVACLVLLSLPGPNHGHLLGYYGSFPALILLGTSAGMFAIPVQVFIQLRPPEGQKGRIIAVMNQANFTAILLSAAIYLLFDRIVVALDWPRSSIFAMTALIMLPVALFYRPPSEPPDTGD